MKIPLLALSAVLLVTTGSLMAQPRFAVGAKLGANVSRMYDSDRDDFVADPKVGYAGGLFAVVPITSFLAVQPEVLVSQRGFIGRGSFLGNEYRLSRTLTYLDLPVMLNMGVTPNFSILAGPYLSYLIHQKDTFTDGTTEFTETTPFDDENLKKGLIGGTAGFDMGLEPVVFGFRVGMDLGTQEGDGSANSIRYKNMWYQFSVGVHF